MCFCFKRDVALTFYLQQRLNIPGNKHQWAGTKQEENRCFYFAQLLRFAITLCSVLPDPVRLTVERLRCTSNKQSLLFYLFLHPSFQSASGFHTASSQTGRFPLRAAPRPTGPGGGGGGTALVLLDYFQEILAGSSSTSVGLDELVKAQSDFMEVN